MKSKLGKYINFNKLFANSSILDLRAYDNCFRRNNRN